MAVSTTPCPASEDLQTSAARAQAWSPSGWDHHFPSAVAHLAPTTTAVCEGTGQWLSAGLREKARFLRNRWGTHMSPAVHLICTRLSHPVRTWCTGGFNGLFT